MTQHTPGPWHIQGTDKNNQCIIAADHYEICTCWHHCVGSIEKEMHANARLIAAAPELLEAANRAADRLDSWADHHRSVARAMNDGPECSSQMNIAKNYAEISQNLRAAIAKATNEE